MARNNLTELMHYSLEKMIYGIGLMLVGVVGFFGVLLLDAVMIVSQASLLVRRNLPMETHLSPFISILPLIFFLVVCIAGIRISTREYRAAKTKDENTVKGSV